MRLHLVLTLLNVLRIARASPAESRGYLDLANFKNVVIIPDVHGDDSAFLRSLYIGYRQIELESSVTFEDFQSRFEDWVSKPNSSDPESPFSTATDTVIVLLGDIIDRGPSSKNCMAILSVAHSVIGWPVERLFGNHELLAMTRGASDELHFVHPNDAESYGGTSARQADFAPHDGYTFRYMADKFLAMAHFGNRSNNMSSSDIRNPNTLFVHAGIDMDWFKNSVGFHSSNIAIFNSIMRSTFSSPKILPEWLSVCRVSNSIFWDRSFAREEEDVLCPKIADILQFFKAARIVVGHTPLPDKRVVTRCGGRIVLADVRMSRWMSNEGQPVALILKTRNNLLSSLKVHYTDMTGQNEETQVLVEIPEIAFRQKRPWTSMSDLPRGRMDQFTFFGEPIAETHNMIVQNAESHHVHGLVLIYVEPGLVDDQLMEHLSGLPAHPGVPRIGSWGLLPGVLQGAGKMDYIFLETDNDRIVKGETIDERFFNIMVFLHSHNVLVGLVPEEPVESKNEWIKGFFSADSNGGNIELIDFTRSTIEYDQNRLKEEIDYVESVISKIDRTDSRILVDDI